MQIIARKEQIQRKMKRKMIDDLTVRTMQENVSFDEIASKLGVHYNTLKAWRKKGLTQEQEQMINDAIDELKKEQVAG